MHVLNTVSLGRAGIEISAHNCYLIGIADALGNNSRVCNINIQGYSWLKNFGLIKGGKYTALQLRM